VVQYGYDGLQRLTAAAEAPGASYAYSYDDAGNRTGIWLNGTRTVTQTFNAANQVAGFSYDAAGNLTGDGTAAFTYDALGRMTLRSTMPYTYTGDGVLVQDGTTRYTQDLAAPLSQVLQTTQSSTTTNYLYGLERLAAVAGSPRTWYVGDALGSVRLTLDDAGAPLGVVHYDPWGTPEMGTVATFGFTGELQDVASGLVNLRARWYQTGQGRFVTRDPFAGYPELPYSQHSYQYAYSDPVSLTDPSGNCPSPPAGSGHVICVDLFIAAWAIGPKVFGVTTPAGWGDNRTFDSNSAPDKSRAYLYLYLDQQGKLKPNQHPASISASCTVVGCFGPYLQYDTFTATQKGESIEVSWSLINGVSGWARSNAEHYAALAGIASRTAPNAQLGVIAGALSGIRADAFKTIEWLVGLDTIDGWIQLTPTCEAGVPRFQNKLRLNRDPYPSLEVYHYYDGREVERLVRRPETPDGPYIGLQSSAPRDSIP
jgi:RHS repeat-associated protein